MGALQISLPTRNLSGLYRTHLLRPSLRRLELLHGTDLVGSVAWHTDVVVAFEDELNVANLEGGGVAKLGETAGAGDDLVDEVICDLEDCLGRVLACCWLEIDKIGFGSV